MDKIYSGPARVTYYDVDRESKLKLSALMRMINIAAEENANDLMIGLNDLNPHNIAFVLQRYGLDISCMPSYNQKLTVRTWPGEISKGMFHRYGEMLATDGSKCMEWITQWVLLDLSARKILRPNALPVHLPQYGNLGVHAQGKRIAIPQGESNIISQSTHTVRYSDLDTNGHTNNTIYGDMIINTMSNGLIAPCDWKQININYYAESFLDDVLCMRCYTGEAPNSYVVEGKMTQVDGSPPKTAFAAEFVG